MFYGLIVLGLLGLAPLAVWPLPAAVALGYTANLVSLPVEDVFVHHVLAVAGAGAIFVAVFMALPHSVSDDGAHGRPVLLYTRTSMDTGCAVVVALVGASFPARLHRDVRWLTSALHAAAGVVAVSGLRRAVGGVMGDDPAAAVVGFAYLGGAGWSFAPGLSPAHPTPGTTRAVVEGPGLYVAAPLAAAMAIVDDGVVLEVYQWAWICAALVVAFALQARPAYYYLCQGPSPYGDLAARYACVRPTV